MDMLANDATDAGAHHDAVNSTKSLRNDLKRLGFNTSGLANFLQNAKAESWDIFQRVDAVLTSLYTATPLLKDTPMKDAQACFVIANMLFEHPHNRIGLSALNKLMLRVDRPEQVVDSLTELYKSPRASSSSHAHIQLRPQEQKYLLHVMRMVFDAKQQATQQNVAKQLPVTRIATSDAKTLLDASGRKEESLDALRNHTTASDAAGAAAAGAAATGAAAAPELDFFTGATIPAFATPTAPPLLPDVLVLCPLTLRPLR